MEVTDKTISSVYLQRKLGRKKVELFQGGVRSGGRLKHKTIAIIILKKHTIPNSSDKNIVFE